MWTDDPLFLPRPRRRLWVSYEEYILLKPEDFEKWEIGIDFTRGGKWGDCNYGLEDYQKDYDEMRQEDWIIR